MYLHCTFNYLKKKDRILFFFFFSFSLSLFRVEEVEKRTLTIIWKMVIDLFSLWSIFVGLKNISLQKKKIKIIKEKIQCHQNRLHLTNLPQYKEIKILELQKVEIQESTLKKLKKNTEKKKVWERFNNLRLSEIF